MTHKLSSAFFGCKSFTKENYDPSWKELTLKEVSKIFKQYSSKLQNILSENNRFSLKEIFYQFINLCFKSFRHWQFEKLSSLVEIAAHVFEYSFQNWLNKQQSFKYFTQIIVRHSLFRPPHSFNVFQYDEMKQICKFWLANFHRYYEEYSNCMSSQLQEKLVSQHVSIQMIKQSSLIGGKQINKQKIQNQLQLQ